MSNLYQTARLLRTVRHLRWSQLAWRGYRLAQRRLGAWTVCRPISMRVDGRPLPETAAVVPSAVLADACETRPARLEDLQQGIFTHLGQRRALGRQRPDWQLGPRSHDRLWVVTLHYHRWLYDLAVVAREAGDRGHRATELLTHYWLDWICRCDLSQPGSRPLAWNAYAIATRLGWWVRAIEVLGQPGFAARPNLRAAVLASMWRQATYLQGHIEWDLQGNHLLRDAVGLAWAGRFFRGRRPQKWLALATRLATSQVREQILPDGGHFERSPMYHLEVMADLLVLADLLTDAKAVGTILESCEAMARCAVWWQHPDGMTPQLGDGARRSPAPFLDSARRRGVVVPEGQPQEVPPASISTQQSGQTRGFSLRENAHVRGANGHVQRRPGPRIPRGVTRGGHYAEATGLVTWHDDLWTVFFDVGPVGPAHQPGHAHADSLTIEASWSGRRLFVDPGCYGYDNDQRRHDDRATQAHNTVCIDQTDSSEVWHIFRVGRRASPHDVHVTIVRDQLAAEAWHDGYDHLPGRPRHRRRVDVRKGGPLVIADQVDGRGRHCVTGSLLVEPGWTVRQLADGWHLRQGTDQVRVVIETSRPIALDSHKAAVHPSYGLRADAIRLVWRYLGPLPLRVATQVTGGTGATSAGQWSAPRFETRHATTHGQHSPSMPVHGVSATASRQRPWHDAHAGRHDR